MFGVPNDRVLKRWLMTGRPRRVDRLLKNDPRVALRLEALTAINIEHRNAIADLVEPEPEFAARTVAGVRKRADAQTTTSLLVDLLGLGVHVGRALAKDSRKKPPSET